MSSSNEYIVELHAIVRADSFTDAEAFGAYIARTAMGARASSTVKCTSLVNVYIADVRGDEKTDEC